MTYLTELRDARAPHAVAAAVWSALLPIGTVAYVAWKVLEWGNDTIDNDQFSTWLTTVGVVAVCIVFIGVWFWRTVRTRSAFAAGICLAAVACYVGYILESIVTIGFKA